MRKYGAIAIILTIVIVVYPFMFVAGYVFKATVDSQLGQETTETRALIGESNLGIHPTYPVISLIKVKDGDTYDVIIRTFHDSDRHITIRLHDFDTPELRPRNGTDEEKTAEKERAKAATDFVKSTFEGKQLYFKYTAFDEDNFGRVLGTVLYLDNGAVKDIRDSLREAGHEKTAQ